MNQSCPVQPKEVKETYAKAGQIYADKVIATRFDDIVKNMSEDSDEPVRKRMSEYREDFVRWAEDAAFSKFDDYPEQGSFLDKIEGGLRKKFPDVEFVDEMDYDFTDSMRSNFANYFDTNKKAISSGVINSFRPLWNGESENEAYIASKYEEVIHAIAARVGRLQEIKSFGIEIDDDMALEDLAYLGGMSAGLDLLHESGDFILKQARAASPDPETQKRYFVDTLDRWTYADNDYIEDGMAWETMDRFQDALGDYINALQDVADDGFDYGDTDTYIPSMDEGQREVFSIYFNKKVGTTSGVPKQGRTPFLLAKKEFTIGGSVEPKRKKTVELTEKSKQILGDYLKTLDSGDHNLDILFDNAEDDDQLGELLVITAKLGEERRKRENASQ